MANDGKIYIIITDKRPSGGSSDISNDKEESSTKDNVFLDFAGHKFFNMIQSQMKKDIMYNINNIGNFTGDYITQKNVNEAMTALSGLVKLDNFIFFVISTVPILK